jgi:hypothetical protein
MAMPEEVEFCRDGAGAQKGPIYHALATTKLWRMGWS